MLGVEQASYVSDYCIGLVFNNGRSGTADLKETIFNDQRPVFSRLQDIESFKRFTVAHDTVIWSDDLDLACEYLFYLTFKDDPKLQEQFKQWGYSN